MFSFRMITCNVEYDEVYGHVFAAKMKYNRKYIGSGCSSRLKQEFVKYLERMQKNLLSYPLTDIYGIKYEIGDYQLVSSMDQILNQNEVSIKVFK